MIDTRIQDIIGIIKKGNYKYISLDFFDTVVIRKCKEPVDVFYSLGSALRDKGIINGIYSPDTFKSIRIKAETQAREVLRAEKGHVEVNISEIYDKIIKAGLLDRQNREAAIDTEVEVEKSFISFNLNIVPLIRYCNENNLKIIIVSDTYFPGKIISAFIDWINAGRSPDEILRPVKVYTSSDYRTGKGENIFPLILEELETLPEEMLHIGDKHFVDKVKPESYKIPSVYLPKYSRTHSEILKYEQLYCSSYLPSDHYIYSIRGGAAHLNPYSDNKTLFRAFDYGSFVIGPVLTGYILWLINEATRTGTEKILFFMREGLLFKGLADRIIGKYNIDIETDIVYSSRISTFVPSINELDVKTLEGMLYSRKMPTVRDFLGTLNLKLKDLQNIQESIEEDGSMADPGVKEIIFRACLLPEIKKKIMEYIEDQRSLLIEYLKMKGLGQQNILFSEIGWKGTIQSNIASALKAANYDVRISCLYLLLIEESVNNILKGGIDMKSYLPSTPSKRLLGNIVRKGAELFEQACMPDEGSTISYKKYDADIIPVINTEDYSSAGFDIKNAMQQGIKTYLEQYLKINPSLDGVNNQIEVMKLLSEDILSRYALYPVEEEVNLASELLHDDNLVGRWKGEIVSFQTANQMADKTVETVYRNSPTWPAAHIFLINRKLLPLATLYAFHNMAGDINLLQMDKIQKKLELYEQERKNFDQVIKDYQRIRYTKAVMFARELEKYPIVMKLITVIYRPVAKAYRYLKSVKLSLK